MANTGQRDDHAPVVLRIKLRYDDEDLFVNRLAHYISEVGMFLRSPRPKPLSTRLIVLFKLANGASILECEGTVCWTRTEDDAQGPAGMGVEFSRLSPSTRPILQRILAARAELGYRSNQEIPYSPKDFSLAPATAAAPGTAGTAAAGLVPGLIREPVIREPVSEPAATVPVPELIREPVVREPTSEPTLTGPMPEPVVREPAVPEPTAARVAPPAPLDRPAPGRLPTAGRPPRNGRVAASAMLARAEREAVAVDQDAGEADLEALLEHEMPELARVLARARVLVGEAGDDDLQGLLDAPEPAAMEMAMTGAARAVPRVPRPSPKQSPSTPAPAAGMRERAPRPAAIPLAELERREPEPEPEPEPEDDLLPPGDAGIPLSELGPPMPTHGRAASEAEYDDDDFPEIETLDQAGPSLGFLHVGSMGSGDSGRLHAPMAPAFELPSNRTFQPGSDGSIDDDLPDAGDDVDVDVDVELDLDAALRAGAGADDADVDLDSMLDSPMDDAAGETLDRAASESSMEPTNDLDLLTDSGPSGLELALQDPELGGHRPALPQVIAPSDADSLHSDATYVMSDLAEVVDAEFDAQSRSSMSLAFDARALDADGILSSNLDLLSNPLPDGDDGPRPNAPMQPRMPPLRAPPATGSVPAQSLPEDVEFGDEPSQIELLDDELLALDDIEVEEPVHRPSYPPPLPGRAPPPPPMMHPEQGMTLDEYEAVQGMREPDGLAGEGEDGEGEGGEDDGDDDGKGSGKKRGFFRRLFNK